MSGEILALGDAASEALAALACYEVTEPAHVQEKPQVIGKLLQDVLYLVFRDAERLSETGIDPVIVDRLYDAGGGVSVTADEVADLAHFSLVRYP